MSIINFKGFPGPEKLSPSSRVSLAVSWQSIFGPRLTCMDLDEANSTPRLEPAFGSCLPSRERDLFSKQCRTLNTIKLRAIIDPGCCLCSHTKLALGKLRIRERDKSLLCVLWLSGLPWAQTITTCRFRKTALKACCTLGILS